MVYARVPGLGVVWLVALACSSAGTSDDNPRVSLNTGGASSSAGQASGGLVSDATGGQPDSSTGAASDPGSAASGSPSQASGGAGTGGSPATGGSGTDATGGASAGQSASSVRRVSVLQHHNHASRDGVYVDAALTKAAVGGMHLDTTFAGAAFTESQPMVYAQPLYLASNSDGPDLVIQVTEQNHVYAFNAADGSIVYNTVVAGALPRTALSSLDSPEPGLDGLCGNITPYLGITGTPIIDPDARILYLDAMTNLGTGASVARHMVYALNADTGDVLTSQGWPVDLDANVRFGDLQFNSFVQNQRGALALRDGKVFVPFGGHWGDCGDYHGWVVGIDTRDPSQVTGWATRAVGGGVWGPSGIASDGAFLYFVTGNTEETANVFSAPDTWQDGETIFKMSSNLVFTGNDDDYFVPSNWVNLDVNDQDLGGSGSVVFDLPGSVPGDFLIAFGKDGNAYIVRRGALGGISDPVAIGQVAAGEIISAAAVYSTSSGVMAVFRGVGAQCPAGQFGGLTAIKIEQDTPPRISTAWCGGPATVASPAVSMTDESGTDAIVWIVSSSNRLHALDATTGSPIYSGGGASDAMSLVTKFTTPIIANGRVFVGANARVYAFTP